ncbi:hypothetical protein ACFO26_02950 [Lactococcus nasutitermitis]|uniref:Phage protein n=1 Tax=Lactococcus nasutitermitis TaxID=1652957 RepID=A0ABV9JAZ1_9LACT|nr:hypothetical protein [Lactococcus nasutitermitis]
MNIIKLNEQKENNEPQKIKSIIKNIQDMTHQPYEISGGNLDAYSDIISVELDRLLEALGLTDLSITAELENKLPKNTLKDQIQDLYSLNDAMISADPNHVPRYTDGTIIKPADLADMNMNALDNIAELVGFELEE